VLRAGSSNAANVAETRSLRVGDQDRVDAAAPVFVETARTAKVKLCLRKPFVNAGHARTRNPARDQSLQNEGLTELGLVGEPVLAVLALYPDLLLCSVARCLPASPVPRIISRFGVDVAGALPFEESGAAPSCLRRWMPDGETPL